MAITNSVTYIDDTSRRIIVEGVLTFDSSYPTGGETITSLTDRIEHATRIDFYDTNGFILDWDEEGQKVLVKSNYHTYTAAVDPASANTDTIADLAVSVPGVVAGDLIIACPAVDIESGVIAVTATATTDTVTLRLSNPTAGTVNGASKTWTFHAFTTIPREVANATDLSALTAKYRAYGV